MDTSLHVTETALHTQRPATAADSKKAAAQLQPNGQIAMRVGTITLVINTVLAAFKLMAGIFGRSSAMVSDAVHTFSDGISTVIVMIGIRVSYRKADEKHQYGYERFECVAAILLAGLLCVAGFGIGFGGIQTMLHMDTHTIAIPTLLPLVAALVSIAAKEGMYWYTITAARRIHSGALKADAWHHRSDAISSVGSFIGILGARLGFPILDPLASVFISLFILKTAYDVFKNAVLKMTDAAADEETVRAIENEVLAHPGVKSIKMLHTRLFADRVMLDMDIHVDGGLSINEAYAIENGVCARLYEALPDVKYGRVRAVPLVTEASFTQATIPIGFPRPFSENVQ